jgi:phage shock protein E
MIKKIVLISLFALIFGGISMQGQNKTEINSLDVKTLVNKNPKIIILDVRTSDEFNQGHIKGAINIDIKQPDAFSKIDKLDKNARYIVHCRTNHRSSIAVNYMEEKGFKNIYQMMDGFNGWMLNNLPVSK